METIKQKNNFQLSSLNKERLKEIIAKFPEAKILIFGDLILDEYLLGSPERISREAPVIILKYSESSFALGGAANAAANAAALGARTTLIGILGEDQAATEFEKICINKNIKLIKVIDKDKGTTTKTRIISSSNSNPDAGTVQKQQVLRIDKEDDSQAQGQSKSKLIELFNNELNNNDLSLLSDYSNGVLSEEITKKCIETAQNKKLVADSNGEQNKFQNIYSLTPNQPDLEKAYGQKIQNENDLLKAGAKFIDELGCQELLVTRGAKGMALINKERVELIPALNLSEVFDVTGAGDTVSAAYCIALAVGASPLEAALIGNLAASLVVRKYGTATVSPEELLELIDRL